MWARVRLLLRLRRLAVCHDPKAIPTTTTTMAQHLNRHTLRTFCHVLQTGAETNTPSLATCKHCERYVSSLLQLSNGRSSFNRRCSFHTQHFFSFFLLSFFLYVGTFFCYLLTFSFSFFFFSFSFFVFVAAFVLSLRPFNFIVRSQIVLVLRL